MVSTLIPTDQPKDLAHRPRMVPLTIRLGDRLTDPAEVACAKAIAHHLSSLCSREVAFSELDGLLLDLWSEDDIEGRSLEDYLQSDRPLQGLLLEARGLSGERIASAELAAFAGLRFEFLSGGADESTLLREKV